MLLIGLCAAALAGLAIGDLARLDAPRLVAGTALALLGAGLGWRRAWCRYLALLVCAVALGAVRATLAAPADDATTRALDPFVGSPLRLRGEVVQPPTRGPVAVHLQLDVSAAGPPGQDPPPLTPASRAPARVHVVGDPAVLGAIANHETLVLEGRLVSDAEPQTSRATAQAEPQTGRAASAFEVQDGRIAAAQPPTLLFPDVLEHQPAATSTRQPDALLEAVRATAASNIKTYLPEPQASLAVGVFLGGSGGLDADFKLDLQRSGLSHLVAIDGFKVSVVVAAIGLLAVRALGTRLAMLPIGLAIVGYTLLTGAHASAIRAALMIGLAMLGALGGRVADPLTSVLLAVVVMAGVEPRILLDLGLQLSLSATLGIVLLWPRWRERLRRLPHQIAEPAGLTLAVTVATLPVTLNVFSLVSLVSPLAHVLGVPLLAPVLLTTALLALVAPIPPLGVLVGWLAWLPASLLVEVIRVCSHLPAAALSTGRLSPLAAGALAGVILAWGVLGLPESAPAQRAWAAVRARSGGRWTPLGALASCLVAVSLSATVRPDARLHVLPLGAGRGQAVLIRGPGGRTTLVVVGRLDGSQLVASVGEHLAIWEHKLDSVVELDPAAEPGLAQTLARYPPVERLDATDNLRVDLGGGAVLDVYAPAESTSPVARPAPPDAAISAPPGVAISFGRVWIPVLGQPPPPLAGPHSANGALVMPPAASDAPGRGVVSDGSALWAAEAPV